MNFDNYREQLWLLVRRTEENLRTIIEPMCRESELTFVQLRVLACLNAGKVMTMGELAKQIHMADANLSPLCKKLEQRGLIKRERDPEDERAVHIRLTRDGAELVRDTNAQMNTRFVEMFEGQEKNLLEIVNLLDQFNVMLEAVIRK